jgi:hypothetical protein
MLLELDELPLVEHRDVDAEVKDERQRDCRGCEKNSGQNEATQDPGR